MASKFCCLCNPELGRHMQVLCQECRSKEENRGWNRGIWHCVAIQGDVDVDVNFPAKKAKEAVFHRFCARFSDPTYFTKCKPAALERFFKILNKELRKKPEIMEFREWKIANWDLNQQDYSDYYDDQIDQYKENKMKIFNFLEKIKPQIESRCDDYISVIKKTLNHINMDH